MSEFYGERDAWHWARRTRIWLVDKEDFFILTIYNILVLEAHAESALLIRAKWSIIWAI